MWEGLRDDNYAVTAGSNQQGRAESSDKLYCIRVYVILN